MKFVSFSAGTGRHKNDDMYKALQRIGKQANQMQIFDEIHTLNEQFLTKDPNFWNFLQNFINKDKTKNTKGYGLYAWKPYVIKAVLEEMNYGDCLIYCDAGCEIKNPYNKNIKECIISMLQKHDFVCFSENPLNHLNYTKGATSDFFNILPKQLTQNGVYYAANRIFIKKTTETVELVSKWLDIMINHTEIYDYSISSIPNPLNYKDSRYDQMVLNHLLYFYQKCSVAPYWLATMFNASRTRCGITKLCSELNLCVCDCCVA